MADKQLTPPLGNQNVNIENREVIKITGVTDVGSFNEYIVDANTEMGRMLIRGEGLKIGKLSLEQKELIVYGYIYSCEYEDKKLQPGNIFSRIFR